MEVGVDNNNTPIFRSFHRTANSPQAAGVVGTQIQNPFLTVQSTQMKLVISVPIKDFIHHYPRALFNDIHRVGAHFYDIPGRGALSRHTQVTCGNT